MRNPFKRMMSNVKKSANTANGKRHNGIVMDRQGIELKRTLKPSPTGGFYKDHKYHEIDITWKDIEKQFIKQKGYDFWIPNYKIDLNEVFKSFSPKAPSVDRLDENEGYVKGNFVITTRFVNVGRGKCSEKVFKEFIKEMFGKPTKIERFF